MNNKNILMIVGSLVVLVLIVLAIFAADKNKNRPAESSNGTDSTNVQNLSDLEGTSWSLIAFTKEGQQMDIPSEAVVTIEFQEDGRFGGKAACNNYFGSFAIEGDSVVSSPIGSTQMACADEDLMNLEFEYLGALQLVSTVSSSREGDLVLSSDNTLLEFSLNN